jgi:hypothetical protein
MEIKANIDALLKFASVLGNIPANTNANVARAINSAGRNIMAATARKIAARLGVSVEEVIAKIKITPATPNNWRWEMDTSEITPPSGGWDEPWERASQEELQQAQSDVLVKIITRGDELVCRICEEAADDNPHSMSEIHDMQQGKFLGEGADAGLLHPNCRCTLQPYTSLRKIPVDIGDIGIEAEPMTANQIAEAIEDSFHTVFRVGGLDSRR